MKKNARDYFDAKVGRMSHPEKRRFDRPDVSQAIQKGEIKSVFLTGVCGKAMAPLAGLFRAYGMDVSGSDVGCYPPMSDFIEELGIKFYEGFSPEYIKDKDLVVVANMFGPESPESVCTRESHVPHLSMSEAVAEFFIKDRRSIVIAGTHGKTTTTGLMAHVFMVANKHPGFLVGGVATPTEEGIQETSYAAGFDDKGQESQYFVIEGDEYDTAYFDKSPKFLHYRPKIAIVTSVEYDHADIYKDFEEYKQSFIFLAEEMPAGDKGGLFVLNGDDGEVRSLAKHAQADVLYYGFSEGCDVTAKDIVIDEQGQHFRLIYKGQDKGQFTIGLFGRYNLKNALSVAAVALNENISIEDLKKGLASFLGMKRRQEIRSLPESNRLGVTVIDDFAHHPTAVRETLSGIRDRYPTRRIIALFEPRSNTSRKKLFEKDYGQAFGDADVLYLSMPALRPEVDNPADFVDGEYIISQLENVGKQGFCIQNGDQALEKMVPDLKKGDVVVVMSNGSFDGVIDKLLKRLA